jgi:HAMP domain-containing protein
MKNRLNPYEAGWLTFLVSSGIASEADCRNAMNRVAQAAIDEINRLREKKRAGKRRKER